MRTVSVLNNASYACLSYYMVSHPEFDHTRFSTIIAVARFARD